MIPYLEISERCNGCDNCRMICPEKAIMTDGEIYQVEGWSCVLCGVCIEVCPVNAIKKLSDAI